MVDEEGLMVQEGKKPISGEGKEFPGLFITFEGCEGSGKTTQVEMLKEHLLRHGTDVVVAREPGGTKVGEKIRDILLDPDMGEITPVTEALLFTADRVQHIEEIIKPALMRGWVVIGDRFVDSSLAYQGVGRGVGLEAVKNLNEWAIGGIEPTLTFYLDLPVEVALARRTGQVPDRIESEELSFHENVRHAYNMLTKIFPYRYIVLDGNPAASEIHANVTREVSRFIEAREKAPS